MYKYNAFDEAFVRSRTAQFRAQVERRIDGSLTEDDLGSGGGRSSLER